MSEHKIYRLKFDVGFGPRLWGNIFRDEEAACGASDALLNDLLAELVDDDGNLENMPDVRVVEFCSRYTCAPEIFDIGSTHTVRVVANQEPNNVWREVAISEAALSEQQARYVQHDYAVLSGPGLEELMTHRLTYKRFLVKPGVKLL